MSKSIWIATTNKGKLREISGQLIPHNWVIKTLQDLPAYTPPPETGKTFLENARIKAKSLAAVCKGDWVMAEDSGLEVKGLGGLPGVHSARYAGENAKDAENLLKVLKMLQLKAVSDRSACFRTALVVIDPNGVESTHEGLLNGLIAKAPAGTEGFGYDSIFIPEGETQTLAQLGLAFKNRVSHRTRAVQAWLSSNTHF